LFLLLNQQFQVLGTKEKHIFEINYKLPLEVPSPIPLQSKADPLENFKKSKSKKRPSESDLFQETCLYNNQSKKEEFGTFHKFKKFKSASTQNLTSCEPYNNNILPVKQTVCDSYLIAQTESLYLSSSEFPNISIDEFPIQLIYDPPPPLQQYTSLKDLIQSFKAQVNKNETEFLRSRVKYALQIAECINKLHYSNTQHGLISTPNIVINDKEEIIIDINKRTPVIIDDSNQESIDYITRLAPEVFDSQVATQQSDAFSFGVFLWQIFTLEEPRFYCRSGKEMKCHEIREFIISGGRLPLSKFENITNRWCCEYIQMIQQCWHHDPSQRPTFDTLVKKLSAIQEFEKLCSLI